MSKQTGLDWFLDYLIKQPYYTEIPSFVIIVAKQMEKEQTEISDEEIERISIQFDSYSSKLFFQLGAKWYREQLKKKYNSEKVNNVPYNVQNEAN